MIGAYLAILTVFLVRRALGGVVATSDSVFYPSLAVQVVAIGINLSALTVVQRRIRSGGEISRPLYTLGVAVDVAAPLLLMLILNLSSPLGAAAALSAPMILLLPLTIMLTTLRLRPLVCIAVGVAAAAGHWGLVLRTLIVEGREKHGHELPVLLSYGVGILIGTFAAAAVAHLFRQTIREAVSEAQASERSAASLRTVERELDIARTIQQGLLPKVPPKLERFEVAGMSRPATQTGGDFYDWQPMPDGRLVVAIADVTGHGIGPALVMAVCRAYCRALTPTAMGADHLLDSVNELISRDLTEGRFITMAVVVAHPDGRIEMLSAGHGPSFLWRAREGKIERFDGQGLPLGVLEEERYTPVQQVQLEPGDMIVLLTDGFMEARSLAGKQFGIARIEEIIRMHSGASAQDVIKAIDAAVLEHSKGHVQDDDMTAVVMRYLGGSGGA